MKQIICYTRWLKLKSNDIFRKYKLLKYMLSNVYVAYKDIKIYKILKLNAKLEVK